MVRSGLSTMLIRYWKLCSMMKSFWKQKYIKCLWHDLNLTSKWSYSILYKIFEILEKVETYFLKLHLKTSSRSNRTLSGIGLNSEFLPQTGLISTLQFFGDLKSFGNNLFRHFIENDWLSKIGHIRRYRSKNWFVRGRAHWA